MRSLEYLVYGIATVLFGWFSIRVFVGRSWSERSQKAFGIAMTLAIFFSFAFYHLSTGQEASDRIQELIICPFHKFSHCPSEPFLGTVRVAQHLNARQRTFPSASESKTYRPSGNSWKVSDIPAPAVAPLISTSKKSYITDPVSGDYMEDSPRNSTSDDFYAGLVQDKIYSDPNGDMTIYLGETSGKILFRILGHHGWVPDISMDVNENGKQDNNLDFTYEFWGAKPLLFEKTMFRTGPNSGCDRFTTRGTFQARKVADWTYQYVYLVPKDEISLSGNSMLATIHITNELNLKKKPDFVERYAFKKPIAAQSLVQFHARYPENCRSN